VKQSGLLKFKVLKWPVINTSDGAKAVIFENNSEIILPHVSRLCPPANTDGSWGPEEQLTMRYKSDAKLDLPGNEQHFEHRRQEITLKRR